MNIYDVRVNKVCDVFEVYIIRSYYPSKMSVRSNDTNKETVVGNEEASTAKCERSKCIRELKDEQSRVQQLIKNFDAKPEEVKAGMDRYESALHKFVNSHENYMKYERDEERKELMTDNYNSQRDMKLQLDCMIDVWKSNRERYKNPPSESGFSYISRKSRSSRLSSRSSIIERRRALEETKLKIQTLKEKQELERQLDLDQQKKTELNRKIELLSAES